MALRNRPLPDSFALVKIWLFPTNAGEYLFMVNRKILASWPCRRIGLLAAAAIGLAANGFAGTGLAGTG